MPIITLTTDFGTRDSYVASIKGSIYKELKDAVIVDISHQVSPFDIAEGAFILKNSYRDFPEGTIHIIGVDVLINPRKRPIVALVDGHYFVTADNGIISLICSEIRPTDLVEINIAQVSLNPIFPIRDILVPVACHLARGGNLSVIGNPIDDFKKLALLQPVVKDERLIVGVVIYVDNYGNSITNISEKFFEAVGKNREFRIYHRNHEFTQIYRNYNEVVRDFSDESQDIGKGMAIFGSSGFLEIAIYKSNPQTVGAANTLYGLKKGEEVFVEFT